MATLRWGAVTHEGQLRTQNEDNHHAGEGLFVVADGMGGHLAGEVASEMAVARLDERLPAGQLGSRDDLVAAINEANVEIYNASLHNADQAGMGTTITAIAVVDDPLDGEVLAVANVGDSRGYVLRHGRLRQVTVDHSFVQELVAEGAITAAEARHHPRRNIVTRALGIEPYVRVDTWTMPIIRGDRFLLCSDGLVDEVADDVIQAILATHPDDPTIAAQALVDAANASGGRDNITAIVVDVLEGDDPPDPTEEFDVIPVWSDEDDDAKRPTAGRPRSSPTRSTTTTPTASSCRSRPRSRSTATPPPSRRPISPDSRRPAPRRPRRASREKARRRRTGPPRPHAARARRGSGARARLRDPRRLGAQRLLRGVRRGRHGRHLPRAARRRVVVRADA